MPRNGAWCRGHAQLFSGHRIPTEQPCPEWHLILSIVCHLGSRMCSPCPAVHGWFLIKHGIIWHSLLLGYTVNVSLAVNGRSSVFPHRFHAFVNSRASESSSPRALGPMTPLSLRHPRRLRWKRSVPWDWLSTGREGLWFSTHGKNMLWNWGSCCQRLNELVLMIGLSWAPCLPCG